MHNLNDLLNCNSINFSLPEKHEGGDAGWMYERLVKTINDFEKDLPNTKQAGGRLVSFQNTVFSIDNIGYWGPDIIMFYGTLENGSSVELVQHISQLNLLLIAVDRKDDLSQPRRKIGFTTESKS